VRRCRFLYALSAGVALAAVPAGGAAIASPTIRMAIVHVVRGCHAWSTATKIVGPSRTLTVARGTRLVVRANCPMDFVFAQTAGPKLNLGTGRTYAGTTRTIVFGKTGVYKLRAKNVQSSEEQGLVTLGPDHVLTLTVRVK
jgi:hypothetical protein